MTVARYLLVGLAFRLLVDPAAAQQEKPKGAENLLARLSYTSTYVADESGPSSPHICFELQRNGQYRISRLAKGVAENLQGKLSQEQLRVLSRLLDGLDFTSRGGGLVRRGSESFVAEVMLGEQRVHLLWIDPDHERPFPKSAVNVIRWLRDFKPDGARPVLVPEFSANPICPLMTDDPLQPLDINPGCSFR